jgi:hypothetical protein
MSIKGVFSATVNFLPPQKSPGSVFTIMGVPGILVKLLRLEVFAYSATPGPMSFFLRKMTSPNIGGNFGPLLIAQHDSLVTPKAQPVYYQNKPEVPGDGNPDTQGSAITMLSRFCFFANPNSLSYEREDIEYAEEEAPCLHTAQEGLSIDLQGAIFLPSADLAINIKWLEETF